jgi:hypothetical protein
LQNNNWVYENDSIKVTYSFWANKGVMSFEVYNKLDKPIYIDWKNSSFIYNGNKLNYWVDEQKSSFASYYGGYYYNGPSIRSSSSIGIQTTSGSTVKPERITFLPPKSNFDRTQFYLLPIAYYNINPKKVNKISIDRIDNLSMETKEQIEHIKSCISILNTVRKGVSEEIVKIDEGLFRIEYQLKHDQKLLVKENDWAILKLI